MLTKATSSSRFVFILAITIRLVYLISYHDSPQYSVPVVDAEEYHNMAADLSQGNLPAQFAFRPPLYPVLLGLVYMLFGKGFLLPRLIQIIMGTLSCVLIQKIGTKLFGKGLGFAAGVLASLCGLMIYFDLELLPTSIVVLFNLLFIFSMMQTNRKPKSAFWAGLWLAASTLTRPVALTFFPFAALWLWFYLRNINKLTQFLIGGLPPLVLSLILHLAIGAGPVLVSAQGGVNFYIGNHPQSDGMTAHLPGKSTGWNWDQIKAKAELDNGQSLTPSQIDRYYWGEGIEQIKAEPIRVIKATWRKARLFWNRVEISSNRDLYYHSKSFPMVGSLMWIGFPLILPLAMTGMFVSIRNKNVQLLALYITISYMTVIPFFVNARFRHPLTPILIVLTLGCIKFVVSIMRREADRKLIYRGVIGMGFGTILLFSADSGIDTKRNDYGLFTDGTLYERMGKTETAKEYYLEALKINPRSTFVNFRLAEMAREDGKLELAVKHYRSEVENQPGYAKAWNNLGVTLMELGETDRALECYQHAIELRPDLSETANNIAKIWGLRAVQAAEDNLWDKALESISISRRYNPGNPVYETLAIEARIHLGDIKDVSTQLEAIITNNPTFQPAIDLLYEIRSKP